MQDVRATIITIGDELLIGQTLDTNSGWMARKLNELGIWLHRRIAIGDVPEEIIHTLKEESARADIILLTGGLGPTDDDKTKAVLCQYFGARLVPNAEILQQVKERVARFSGHFLERNRAQALVPDLCTPLFNERGTAPGMWFEQEGKIYVSMPGVPYEMEGMMENEVLPRLARHFRLGAILHRTLITAGIPEAELAETLSGLEQSLPAHISLAYLPGLGVLKLRLTARGTVAQEVAHGLDQYAQQLENLVGDAILAREDLPLEALVGARLKARGLQLALAESCTGGYLAHLITTIAGSSAYFKGGVVAYHNEVKTNLLDVPSDVLHREGAVSEAVVRAMLQGVLHRLQADVGIAISGILGPSGGTADKPVGTVWVAAGGRDQVYCRKLQLRYDRKKNLQMAANLALRLLLDALKIVPK